MSNVVGGGVAVLFALAWVVLQQVSDVLWEYLDRGVRKISRSVFEEDRIEISSSCLSIDTLISSSRHRHVIERFFSIVEREVESFETHSSSVHAVFYVFRHLQLFLLGSIVLIGAACFCSCHFVGPRRVSHVPSRKPNSRPVLQRGGGTLA
jgi:hypothetical protein